MLTTDRFATLEDLYPDTLGLTGAGVPCWGVFQSACCGEERAYRRGEVFSACPRCHRACHWHEPDWKGTGEMARDSA